MEAPIPNTISWVTPAGNIGTVMEREAFIKTVVATSSGGFPVTFSVIDGIFPSNLNLDPSGTISGVIIDMDEYVPVFMNGDEYVPAIDGSNYAESNSAAVGSYSCSFTIRASSDDGTEVVFEDRVFSINVINNWDSDRNQMVRKYAEVYGEDNKIFTIDGIVVDTEVYIDHNGWSIPEPTLEEIGWIFENSLENENKINFSSNIDFSDEVRF